MPTVPVSRRSPCTNFARRVWLITTALLCSDCSGPNGGPPQSCRDCLLVFPTFQFGQDQPAFRARDENGVEFSVYADQTNGAIRITQIDTVLTNPDTTTLTVRTPVDADGLPTRMESADDTTATLAIDKVSGRLVAGVVDKFGQRFNKEVSLPSATIPGMKGRTSLQTGQTEERRLCNLAANYSEVLRLVFNCDDGSDSPFCTGALADTAVASESFCRLVQQIVAQLDSSAEAGPALPFGVGFVVVPRALTCGLFAELGAAAFSGAEPYRYAWTIASGPAMPTIEDADQQFARLTFDMSGEYILRVTATDAGGQTASDELPFNVITARSPECPILTIESTGCGRTDPPAGQYELTPGAVQQLSAIPDAGCHFVGWLGDQVSGFTLNQQITVDGPHTVRAVFEPIPAGQFALELVVDPIGAGGFTLDPPGRLYDPGTQVRITAEPNSGFTFEVFADDLGGPENPQTLSMDRNRRVTAIFAGVSP